MLELRIWDRDAPRREQLRAATKEIARLTKDLRKAIHEAIELFPLIFEIDWAPDGYEGDEDDCTVDLFGLMSILDDFGTEFERLASPPTKKVANRPPGTVQNPALSYAIDCLYQAIVKKTWRIDSVGKRRSRAKGYAPFGT
jgi:hypothetical protein